MPSVAFLGGALIARISHQVMRRLSQISPDLLSEVFFLCNQSRQQDQGAGEKQ
jgi:hypothetical protein